MVVNESRTIEGVDGEHKWTEWVEFDAWMGDEFMSKLCNFRLVEDVPAAGFENGSSHHVSDGNYRRPLLFALIAYVFDESDELFLE